MVIPGGGNPAPSINTGRTGVGGLNLHMRMLSDHHGAVFISACILAGKSLRVSITFGLDIGAVVYVDLVRASDLVVAEKQNYHPGDLLVLFRHLGRVDLDRHPPIDTRSTDFGILSRLTMLKQFQFVWLTGLLIVLSLVACQATGAFDNTATPPPAQVESIPVTTNRFNLIELADLDQTKQIRVMRRLAGSDCSSTECEELFVLSDQGIIQE